jgi:uncharacterized protein involved in exopolysaccharide biosynthesis
MRPYIMTALRNPLLWIVPAVLLPLLVAIGAIVTSRQARVEATVWTQVSSLIDAPGGSVKPPAEVEAATFNERLNTESFRSAVITAAGLDERVKNGDWPGNSGIADLFAKFPLTKPLAGLLGASSSKDEQANRDRALATVKSSITAEARGNNLLYVIYTGDSADTGIALVSGAIDTYQKENLGQTSTEAQAVIDFYTKQVAAAQQGLEAADNDLRAFEAEHPSSPAAPRPASEAQQLASLQSTYNIRLSQYELALNRQSDAEVRAQASLTTSDNDFQIVDQPHAPPGLTLNLRHAAMLTFIGIVFGFGLGALLIVLRTWFDDTVRGREDVKRLFGFEVLATLPNLKKGGE